LNAEQEFLSAQVNLVQAQHDEAVANYTLRSAVGQLTAQGLGLPVDVYDPVKHYDDVRDKWIGTGISPKYGETQK
jgi:outer membrane protein